MRKTVVLLIAILSLFSCRKENYQVDIKAVKGIINLSAVSEGTDWSVSLDGEWGFYWDRFAFPETAPQFLSDRAPAYIDSPGYWNDQGYPSFGTAVYTMTILTSDNYNLLGIKLFNLNPNFVLYANGQRIFQCGEPHPERSLSRAANTSLVLPLVPEDGRIDLVLTQSNWHTNKPGMFNPPMIGPYRLMLNELMRKKISESLFIGGMLLLSLFLFCSYIYNQEDKGQQWLALIILSAAFYTSVKGPLVFMDLFQSAGGEVRSKIIYLVLLTYPFFTYMQYSSQKNLKINRTVGRIDRVVVALASVLILFTHKGVFTKLEIPFIIHALGLSLYVIFVLIRDFLGNRTLEAALALAGDLLLLLAVILSMVDNSVPMKVNGLASCFFYFCLFQTVLQARFASKNQLLVRVLSERNRTLKDQKDQYENQALMDHLTRVKNRRSLDSFLKKSWDMGAFLGQGIGIIMVDIDFFKKYNDSLGHKKGDVCLVQVAEALSGSLKRNQDFIARYGGEEFIVIIQGVDSLFSLIAIAEHLRQSVEFRKIPHPDSDCSPYVTISVGAEYQIPEKNDGYGADELIHRADTALYLAKNRGRNRVETVSSPDRENQVETLGI